MPRAAPFAIEEGEIMQLKWWCTLALGFALVTARAEEPKKEEAKPVEAKKEEKKAEKKDKKDDKKEIASVSFPEPVARAWMDRYKHVQDVHVKDRGGSYEFTGRDEWNEKIKVVYGADGKLWEEDERKLPLSKVPAAVVETAKKWAPSATWSEVAEVETDDGELPVYEIEGTLNGKRIEADIREDGSVKKADKLEGEKSEKKAEKKEEKKEVKAEAKKEEPKKEEAKK
ncbi:MAG TPA: hypothetical protein VEJ63_02350 [Planctomycetota bacterium]|nr:hypothetical protein [Planctomycetota bacterium]